MVCEMNECGWEYSVSFYIEEFSVQFPGAEIDNAAVCVMFTEFIH